MFATILNHVLTLGTGIVFFVVVVVIGVAFLTGLGYAGMTPGGRWLAKFEVPTPVKVIFWAMLFGAFAYLVGVDLRGSF